jgi:hypothetical protein
MGKKIVLNSVAFYKKMGLLHKIRQNKINSQHFQLFIVPDDGEVRT